MASEVPTEQVVFEQAFEGLFLRGVGQKATVRLKQRLRELGVDLDKKLRPAYPFDVWMKALRLTAEELYSAEPLERGLFRLGELMIDGYHHTFLGRAVLGMVRVVGPKRTLQRARQSFRSGNNYTEARLDEVNPTCHDLWMNEVGPYPTFTAGILSAALRAAGVTPTVEPRGHDGHACTYRVSWVA